MTAPTVNSYKRLKQGSTTSGATWSPVWISYGYNNRTQMLRIPAPGRIEDRTVDGSANPYLAATAVLAAGLDGIEKELDAGDPNADNLYEHSYEELTARGLRALPANLLESIGELERDDVLRAAFGRGRAEDYIDYYAKVKRDEWFRYHEQVTGWEINEYLTRF
jgi:glutamine synthetase